MLLSVLIWKNNYRPFCGHKSKSISRPRTCVSCFDFFDLQSRFFYEILYSTNYYEDKTELNRKLYLVGVFAYSLYFIMLEYFIMLLLTYAITYKQRNKVCNEKPEIYNRSKEPIFLALLKCNFNCNDKLFKSNYILTCSRPNYFQ